MAELFAEKAETIPNFIQKGSSNSFRLNLWDGFHKALLQFGRQVAPTNKKKLDEKYSAMKDRLDKPGSKGKTDEDKEFIAFYHKKEGLKRD